MTDWSPSLELVNCTMHVSKAGRERVLRERRKNVHAHVRGRVGHSRSPSWQPTGSGWTRLTYNPYRHGSFMANGRPVVAAYRVRFVRNGAFAAGIIYGS